MMEAEIYAIRKALKLVSHTDSDIRDRALAAERALDAIEQVLAARKDETTAAAETGPALK